MAYANCPACHLTIAAEHGPFEECPRCRKRDDESIPMFVSPSPYRELAGPLLGGPISVSRSRRRAAALDGGD